MFFLNGRKLCVSEIAIAWWCPGCDCPHMAAPHIGTNGYGWSWDGNPIAPTITPELLVRSGLDLCHCSMTVGTLQFFKDCTHHLAGKATYVPEWPDKTTH